MSRDLKENVWCDDWENEVQCVKDIRLVIINGAI